MRLWPLIERPPEPAPVRDASRYQSLRFQKVLSHPLSVALSLLEIAHLRAAYNRDDDPVLHHHIIHGNEQRRSLDRIEFALGRMNTPERAMAPRRDGRSDRREADVPVARR